MSEIWNSLQALLGNILSFFYDLVPNYGFAIICLTIVVNILVFPLTLKQVRSTRAMQEIQPEMERLRREYKGDQETMNQKVMELYRERGVSPFGCVLPLLVQMPVWFALFQVLRNPANSLPADSSLLVAAGEGALRFLTMDLDLAPSEVVGTEGLFAVATIPYLLLVGFVILTGYMQQKLLSPPKQSGTSNPQAEAVQRMTKILPLMFGVISYIWPSGLNLYFATSNVFRTGQQLLIFKIDGRPGPPPDGGKPATKEPDDGEPDDGKKPPRPQGSAKKQRRRRRR
ncbi:MAG: YidC/Oxa1 family membrane protein insertase [Acidimicrobiia bacterium]|nr:YidC/Oxa1 family membrane protein insertase [Acidimicrobiia bacterium]MYF82638.1 YidC/Oxa1 family membrane protein insertase [Acidimicrobiia bacterium]